MLNLINNKFLFFFTENFPILNPYLPQKSENLRPHSSQSSCENATPSSGTSPLASCKGLSPPPTPPSPRLFRSERGDDRKYVCGLQVIQKVDSAIHWISFDPLDNAAGKPNTYPVDSIKRLSNRGLKDIPPSFFPIPYPFRRLLRRLEGQELERTLFFPV